MGPMEQAPQAPQQNVSALVRQAEQMAGDPEFAKVTQDARELATDLPTGFAIAIMHILPAFQSTHKLDDDTLLGPVLVAMIVKMLEIADHAGDEEATPDQVEAIHAKVIDLLGRADAHAELGPEHGGMDEAQEPGNEQEPGHEQTEPMADMQAEGERPRGRLSAMIGAR